MPLLFRLIILVVAFVLSISISFAKSFNALVIGVADGDTITSLWQPTSKKFAWLQLIARKRNKPLAPKAKCFTSNLVFNNQVTVYAKSKDRYGRTIANIYLADGRFLNSELVKDGFARLYTAYSHDETLKALEDTARQNHLGLWKDPNPIPLRQFRRTAKSHSSK